MPLGVRDVLLVIRAKDQASRAIGDVGRSFGNLGRKQAMLVRESQKQMVQFNRQAANIKQRVGDATRAQINDINKQLRQNTSISAQLATRNARLRMDYMFTQGAAKKAILQEMLANDIRRKELAEINAAHQRHALSIRQASDQTLRKQLGDIEKLKAAEMDLRRVRVEQIQLQRERGIARMQRGQAIGGIGVGLTAGGVASLAFFANATKHAMAYRDEASKTFTQVDERLGASVKKLEEMGVRVARNVPIPFKQMQETLYEIFSSMEIDNLPQAERLLTAVSKAAVAGATDIKTAGDATISILNGFKIPIEDVSRVLDVQFRTVKEGRITYEELARTIGRAIPSAAAAGQTIEDLGGMMAFLTRNGLSAAMAATSAARAFDLLKHPKFLAAMQSIGLSVVDAEKNFRPMVDVMTELRERMTKLPTAEATKLMNEFLGSVTTPKALKALEDMGIRVKNIADPKIAANIKNNTVRISDLNLKAAQLRVRKGGASKEEKKAIDAQLRQIQLQKAQISNASAHMRANAGVAGSLRPINEIMADLEEKLKNVSEAERAEIMTALTKGSGGTIQAMRFVNLALTDTNNLLGIITGEVANSGGAFEKAYKIMSKTPGAKIQQLKNNWETFRQEIGARAIPIALKLIEKLSGVAKWLGKLDKGTKDNIVKWGLIAGAVLTVVGVLTILSGVLLVLSGAFAMLASSGLGVALLGFGKFVIAVIAIKKLLESSNPVLKTFGILLAAIAARAILVAIGGLAVKMGLLAANTAMAGGAALITHARLTAISAIKFGPLLLGLYAITSAAMDAKKRAREMVDSLTKDVEPNNLESMQTAIGKLDRAQGRIKRQKGPMAWAKGAIEILTPLENSILNANEAYNKIGLTQVDIQKRFDKTHEIFGRVSRATGLTLDQVERLADGMDIDITASARSSVLKLIEAHRLSKGVGEEYAATFRSATSLIHAYGDEADASKIKIRQFYEEQLKSTREWSDNIKFLASQKLDPTFLKELMEKGPAAAGLVAALRAEVEKPGGAEFINQSIIDLDQIKLDTAKAVNEVLQILNNADPVLKVKVEMERINLQAVFGGGGGLSIFGHMPREMGAPQTPAAGFTRGARSGFRGWGGRRQHGGLVTAGKTYLVGERRAELFTPHTSGTISPRVPSTATTGGNTYNKQVIINPKSQMSASEIADSVSWALRHQ